MCASMRRGSLEERWEAPMHKLMYGTVACSAKEASEAVQGMLVEPNIVVDPTHYALQRGDVFESTWSADAAAAAPLSSLPVAAWCLPVNLDKALSATSSPPASTRVPQFRTSPHNKGWLCF